jgi:sec-independent protein translocase protein TatA
MPNLGPTELIIIFLIVIVLFGGRKIPEIARGLGKGIRDFKTSLSEDEKPAVEAKSNATTQRPEAGGDKPTSSPSA